MKKIIDSVDRFVYGKYFIVAHIVSSIVVLFVILALLSLANIKLHSLINLINSDTIAILSELAGFEFAGVSILISLTSSKKMETIQSVGKDGIVYRILITSIICFLISIILMLLSLNVLSNITNNSYKPLYYFTFAINWSSLYMLLLGFICFISSLRFISWIFK